MEDVSKLDVMAKVFTSSTMVKVTGMNINKRNVTWSLRVRAGENATADVRKWAAVRCGIFNGGS